MITATRRAGPDIGRLIMVPAAAAMLVLDLAALTRGDSPAAALRWVGTVLVCAFYALIIWGYLRRGPARATNGSVTGSAAAVLATLAPFAFPLLHGTAGVGRQLAGDLLLVGGLTWSVWALRCLGRNLSVLAQARELTDTGPYRLVRHPLYTGELVSALGLAIAAGTMAAFGLLAALIAMQAYRAVREEQVLTAVLPGYQTYRTRTAALLPGIF
jgi:protein-S-isoprenylcysteine O-methyltransferase Ste14